MHTCHPSEGWQVCKASVKWLRGPQRNYGLDNFYKDAQQARDHARAITTTLLQGNVHRSLSL